MSATSTFSFEYGFQIDARLLVALLRTYHSPQYRAARAIQLASQKHPSHNLFARLPQEIITSILKIVFMDQFRKERKRKLEMKDYHESITEFISELYSSCNKSIEQNFQLNLIAPVSFNTYYDRCEDTVKKQWCIVLPREDKQSSPDRPYKVTCDTGKSTSGNSQTIILSSGTFAKDNDAALNKFKQLSRELHLYAVLPGLTQNWMIIHSIEGYS